MKIVSFVEETRASVVKRLLHISGGTLERRQIPFNVGTADVSVISGGLLDKAAVTHLVMNQVVPPEATEPLDYMVFQVEIFPASPYCPMGHFNTEWSVSGQGGPYHMILDLFPAVDDETVLEAPRKALDDVAARFGVVPASLRNGLAEQYNMNHWDRPLASNTGCKLMHLDNARLDLFIDSYHTFFDSYLALLAAVGPRQAQAEALRAKMRRNGKWLEYLTLKDVAVKMALATGISPEVIVQLSYPPSAVF